ncbi:MAG: DUF1622 domain-containing protein [Anaerolineae bacterium]
MEQFSVLIEGLAWIIEAIGVLIIVNGLILAVIVALYEQYRHHDAQAAYTKFRRLFGRILLLGLEVLVAADIVRTVALEPTLQNVGILALLVLIRTFLSWSLVVELEGRWPWQAPREGAHDTQEA